MNCVVFESVRWKHNLNICLDNDNWPSGPRLLKHFQLPKKSVSKFITGLLQGD
jgi:hypothetical protein